MDFFKKDTTAKILFVGYIILFTALAFNPYDRADWWAENVPIAGIAIVLAVLYSKGIKFSPTAYVLMAVLVYMHTIGGYYTFERVPFGWFNNTFGFKRNMYDRVAHFTVGFYAYAISELLYKRKLVKNKIMLFLFSVFAIATVAMSYELLEWWFAASYGGNSGAAFLGSQGDIWDAQKDMLCDTLGGILAGSVFLWQYRKKKLA